jgi:hypothetical protein
MTTLNVRRAAVVVVESGGLTLLLSAACMYFAAHSHWLVGILTALLD